MAITRLKSTGVPLGICACASRCLREGRDSFRSRAPIDEVAFAVHDLPSPEVFGVVARLVEGLIRPIDQARRAVDERVFQFHFVLGVPAKSRSVTSPACQIFEGAVP
jgi:hypothetical protein